MSLGTGEPASETGDDSLSAITFDSDFETKTKRKSFHKPPPTSPKSPYHSKPRKVASWRSLRTAGSMPLGGRVSLTPQKLWLGTSKPGSLTQPLKSNLTLEHTWTKPPSSTPDYLTEALRMKRSDLRHSASNGHVPGIPVYREKEDMYDEIIELKKSLHMQKNDMDLMRTKLRRLEEENNRKDRQIEQLLEPSRGSDFVRTLAEKRPDTGWVINGLKQRILKLEQQCKEKDTTINKLQTDMKTTNLEEMRIAMETYYEEIHRLQTLLASCDTTGKKPPGEKKMSARRQKKVNSALLNLSRSVQELTEENQSLKEDLDRVLSNSPTVSKVKAGYTEWSKPRLLRRISELEKKISSVESLKLRPSELAKSSPLAHSSSSSTVNRQLRGDRDCREEQERLRGCCGEEQERLRGCREEQERLQEEQERLRGTLRSLKGERDALQAQLLERGLEVKQLLQIKADLEKELENMREWEKERRKQEEALKEEVQTLTNKFQELREMEKEEKDDPMEVTHETQEEQASAPSSRYSEQDLDTDFCGGWLLHSHPPSTERRRDIAARTLQAQWKVYKHKKKKAILDEAAMVLQAAFKGHLARVKLLASKACDSEPPSTPSLPNQPQSSPTPCILSPIAQTEGNPGQEEAITVIQSVLRAHLAQANHSTTSKRTTTAAGAKRRPTSATHKETSSPPILAASPGKEDSEASSGEAVEDEDRLGESAAPGPCSAPFLSRPLVPPPVDDVNSDDSDDVVIAPPLPMRKSSSPV
ncbi:IQ domain-containing protein E isoform X3 [Otolemur garnettii]|uniref:IQ domain-containing protein E isoform X3 n=1 Tax=Otolemur garnettii TaxID=30611 RepID=UPI000C7F0914|nr:IQ domain-containing protein E isoform X3 [Otolemur garnettii]